MKLNYEQIKEIVRGTAYTEQKNGTVLFHRFTVQQEAAYSRRSSDFSKKAFASAGVFMEFVTDSESLKLSAHLNSASSRSFYGCDVVVDGEIIACANGVFARGESETDFELCAYLGRGEKRVLIRFPWSAKTSLKSFELEDGAYIKPHKRDRLMIMFGDSITQGYDSKNPSLSYASRLSDALSADAVNKAIGGEMFWQELADMRDDITPDLITVAYGTNDWSLVGRSDFERNCRGFYENLGRNYPSVKIFAITPIWRADCNEDSCKEYPFLHVAEHIKAVTRDMPNVTVINGFDFIPHNTELFSDGYLHPNDEGFSHYAEAIINEITTRSDMDRNIAPYGS